MREWRLPIRKDIQQMIDIGNGFGVLKFGCKQADVENILGCPDEVEVIDDELMAVWYYKRFKIQIGFFEYRKLPLRVVSFLTGSPSSTLWGTRIIGMGKPELLRLFAEHDCIGFSNCENELAERGYETLRLEKSHVTLDFYNGILKRMLWGAVDEYQEVA
jgi:hypothetical protein